MASFMFYRFLINWRNFYLIWSQM